MRLLKNNKTPLARGFAGSLDSAKTSEVSRHSKLILDSPAIILHGNKEVFAWNLTPLSKKYCFNG
jgi:hypothetical protein